MYLRLLRRHNGVQRTVKDLWLPIRLDQAALPDGRINEELLLRVLPPGWLPERPENVLLTLAHAGGSTGLRRLERFRPWARHFDAWVLEAWRDEPP